MKLSKRKVLSCEIIVKGIVEDLTTVSNSGHYYLSFARWVFCPFLRFNKVSDSHRTEANGVARQWWRSRTVPCYRAGHLIDFAQLQIQLIDYLHLDNYREPLRLSLWQSNPSKDIERGFVITSLLELTSASTMVFPFTLSSSSSIKKSSSKGQFILSQPQLEADRSLWSEVSLLRLLC